MQKIDKTTIILSTRYKTWEEDLETNGKRHPKYTSSNHEFYYDIVMNLFHLAKSLIYDTLYPVIAQVSGRRDALNIS